MGAGIAAGPHFHRVLRSAFLTECDHRLGVSLCLCLRARRTKGLLRVSGLSLPPFAGHSIPLPDVHFRAYPASVPFDPSSGWGSLKDARFFRRSSTRNVLISQSFPWVRIAPFPSRPDHAVTARESFKAENAASTTARSTKLWIAVDKSGENPRGKILSFHRNILFCCRMFMQPAPRSAGSTAQPHRWRRYYA